MKSLLAGLLCVPLIAVVTDRAGNHVAGLTRDDFQVYEDGELRQVTEIADQQRRTLVVFSDGAEVPAELKGAGDVEHGSLEDVIESHTNVAIVAVFSGRNSAIDAHALAEKATARGITIYALCLPGARNTDIENLQYVVEQTGGLIAWESRSVIDLLPMIERDLSSYYSLTYPAAHDRAHAIVVKAKNDQYTVRTRLK